MPAVGLTGWLAHTPHWPFDVELGGWREQMFVWLSGDLVTSAWAWSRIALFMQAKGKYLLNGRLARPSELAQLRWHPDKLTKA
ncbi:hypothetical protein [Paraburkholderia sp. 32]|uniref:hypothetical protein n=1 Tax=Paraburkholderia sp. 32 TaxID=2991057 RepID=UPI003D21AC9B